MPLLYDLVTSNVGELILKNCFPENILEFRRVNRNSKNFIDTATYLFKIYRNWSLPTTVPSYIYNFNQFREATQVYLQRKKALKIIDEEFEGIDYEIDKYVSYYDERPVWYRNVYHSITNYKNQKTGETFYAKQIEKIDDIFIKFLDGLLSAKFVIEQLNLYVLQTSLFIDKKLNFWDEIS